MTMASEHQQSPVRTSNFRKSKSLDGWYHNPDHSQVILSKHKQLTMDMLFFNPFAGAGGGGTGTTASIAAPAPAPTGNSFDEANGSPSSIIISDNNDMDFSQTSSQPLVSGGGLLLSSAHHSHPGGKVEAENRRLRQKFEEQRTQQCHHQQQFNYCIQYNHCDHHHQQPPSQPPPQSLASHQQTRVETDQHHDDEDDDLDDVAFDDLPQRFAALSTEYRNDEEANECKTDMLVAKALSNLTPKQREASTFEQHGILELVEDEPGFDRAKVVAEFQWQLQHLKTRSRLPLEALRHAEEMNYGFVHNEDNYMKFLRTEGFDTRKAAIRFIKNWDMKQYLFGQSKLCQEISLSDLDESEIKMARKGYFQWLPSRDMSGRAISVSCPRNFKYGNPKSLVRILWAQEMRDEETCKNGIVGIMIYTEPFKLGSAQLEEIFMLVRYKECMPLRFACDHILVSGEHDTHERIMDFVLALFKNETRAKVKLHRGTHTEQMYSLLSYGIPVTQMPVTPNGTVKTKAHHEYLRMIEMRHSLNRQGFFDTIDVPSNNDILCGKGKPLSNHIGNARLHNLVEDLMDDYDTLEKKEKSKLAKSVVMQVKAKSGRFISKDSGIWREVNEDVATTKVSQLFRARRKVMNVKNNNKATIDTQSEMTSHISRADSRRETPSAQKSNKRGRSN